MSWLWGSSINAEYEEAVEKACSPLKLPYPTGEDIALNLEIADLIRAKTVQPKQAMQSLKQRVAGPNGRVQMYAMSLVDTCIKNGGDHFLDEIASKEFVDAMSGVMQSSTTSPEVKSMALQKFQEWALAFQSKKEPNFLVDVYQELKNSGIKFPPPPANVTSSSMLETATAPKWMDSDVCMRCRTPFTFTNRRHHCRNCGRIFDQACSSHVMALPKFGIKEEVRVCDGCWIQAGKNKPAPAPAPAVPTRTPRSRQDYDADLQRAIELSLTEAQPGRGNFVPSEPPLALKNGRMDMDEDEQLRLAIEASLREMERTKPSAPLGVDDGAAEPQYKPLPTYDLSSRETESILAFSNSMDQMAAYGERDLRRFPQAHVLRDQVAAVGTKLQRNRDEKNTKQQMLSELQGKLNEAVALYGQILDGQQAFAAHRAQEAQHAQAQSHQQYAQYQPPYGHPHQQYGAPAANGYYVPTAPQAYAPPPQAAASAHAAPSMYPSMPPQGAATYVPYQPVQEQPYGSAPYAQPHAPPHQLSYAAYPQHVPENVRSYGPAVPDPQLLSSPIGVPSAPPPVDLASHPSVSPHSVTSALPVAPSAPQRSASYASPAAASAPLGTSPIASPPQRAHSYAAPVSPVQAMSPLSAPQRETDPQLQPHQPHSIPQHPDAVPQQSQPPHDQRHYTPTMFPSAPQTAMFPAAPQNAFDEPAPAPVAKAPEEALLIEL